MMDLSPAAPRCCPPQRAHRHVATWCERLRRGDEQSIALARDFGVLRLMVTQDKCSQTPFLYGKQTTASVDNPQSIAPKTSHASYRGLGSFFLPYLPTRPIRR